MLHFCVNSVKNLIADELIQTHRQICFVESDIFEGKAHYTVALQALDKPFSTTISLYYGDTLEKILLSNECGM